jgi:hypothetical protein
MFSLTEDAKGKSLALFYADGDSETIPESHVSFKPIIDLLISGKATDEEVRDLTGVLETVARKMSALSERVSVDGKNIYFDGDPLAGELSEVIKSLFAEGKTDFQPLVNFLEKAKTNPSLSSVDDLYRWIKNGDLVIDPDGDIIAYKGVQIIDGVSHSISSGTAFVNGEQFTGYIPNKPGSVISMPRSEVDPESEHYCSTGLHAGTYSYASSFARGRLILVKFNPRDVVSCPTDSSSQKLRISRYVVLSEIEQRLQTAYYQPTLTDWDGDDDEDDEDGYEYDCWECEDYGCSYCGEEDEEEDDEEEEVEDSTQYWTRVLNPTSPIPAAPPVTTLPVPEEPEEEEPEDEDDEEKQESLSDRIRAYLKTITGDTPPAKKDSNGRYVL